MEHFCERANSTLHLTPSGWNSQRFCTPNLLCLSSHLLPRSQGCGAFSDWRWVTFRSLISLVVTVHIPSWLERLLHQVHYLWTCCYYLLLSDSITDKRISCSPPPLTFQLFWAHKVSKWKNWDWLVDLSEMSHLQLIQTFIPQSWQMLISWSLRVLHLWAYVLLQLFSAAPALPWVILHSHHYLPCTSSSAHCLVLHWECSREQQSLPSSHTCFLLFSSVCISVCRPLLTATFSLVFFFFFWIVTE